MKTTTTVVALKQHTYANIPRKTGEQYEAEPDTLNTLIAVGFAKIKPMAAAVVPEPEPLRQKPNQYNRRDMRARPN